MQDKVAKTWIQKAIRNPLLSLFSETDQSLLFTKDALQLYLDRKGEETKRILILQVRVKGILQDLVAGTNTDVLPVPFIRFLKYLFHNGAFVEDGFLTNY